MLDNRVSGYHGFPIDDYNDFIAKIEDRLSKKISTILPYGEFKHNHGTGWEEAADHRDFTNKIKDRLG